jgi:hypothetical protein
VAYDNKKRNRFIAYSKRVDAGRKRSYFFDIREMRNGDFSLIITENTRRFDDNSFETNEIFVFQEDINKFTKALEEAVVHLKTQLLPHYDFSKYDKPQIATEATDATEEINYNKLDNRISEIMASPKDDVEFNIGSSNRISPNEEVDKW